MNKKFLSLLLSIVLPLFIVSAVVYSATTVGDAVSVGSTLAVTGATTLDGDVTLGDATSDVLTPIGYFTYARIGTGTSFSHIGVVAADELGVEGQAEIDGPVWLDGAVSLGDAAADGISVVGTLYTPLVWAATTSANLIDLDAASSTTGKDVRLSNGAMILVGESPNTPTGSTTNGSLYISSSGYGLYVNYGNYWWQLATTTGQGIGITE